MFYRVLAPIDGVKGVLWSAFSGLPRGPRFQIPGLQRSSFDSVEGLPGGVVTTPGAYMDV